MNSWERVMNTIQGKPADRIPVIAVLSLWGSKLTGVPIRTLYNDPAAYDRGQAAVIEQFGTDAALLPFDYGALAEAFGARVVWFDNQAPNVRRPAAKSPEESLESSLPDPETTGRLPALLESSRLLKARFAGRVPVFSAIPGPSGIAVLMLGMEKWLETFLFDPETAERILEKAESFFVRWGNALFAAGTDGLIMTEPMSVREIAPRELFETRIIPRLSAIMGKLTGPVVFHHSGGSLGHVLDLVSCLPSVLGVSVSSRDKLSESREKLGDKPLLLGNLDNLSFPRADSSWVKSRALECLQTAAGKGPYILANSGADIPLETPQENILALVEASKCWARECNAGETS